MAKASQKKALTQDAKAKSVNFSKLRYEIFKKASELCTLCAVEMAIIIFSPCGKAYSFGNPSVDTIIKRYTHSENSNAYAAGKDEAQREAVLDDLNKQYSDLLSQLDAEKKRGEKLKQQLSTLPNIEKMNRAELLKMKASLEDLRQKVRDRKVELLAERPVNLSLTLGGIYSAENAASSTKHQSTGVNSSANVV